MRLVEELFAVSDAAWTGISPGRVCHFALSSTVIDCHSLVVCIVTLLSLLSSSAQMTDSPWATLAALPTRQGLQRPEPAVGRRGGREAVDRVHLRVDRGREAGVVQLRGERHRAVEPAATRA